MSKRYGYGNQKGGVSKTTTTVNHAVAGTLVGKRVCVVDLDSQGSATYALGYRQNELKHTLFTLLKGESTLEETLLPTYYDPESGIFFDPSDAAMMQTLGINSLRDARSGPDLIPNNKGMLGVETELAEHASWGLLLHHILEEIDDDYDEIHIDTSPSLGKGTRMMFRAATDIVIPVIGENWAIQGLIEFSRELALARMDNPTFSIAGVLFTRAKYKSHREVMEFVQTNLIHQINEYFEGERMESASKRKRLAGLEISCFPEPISESAEFGDVTKIRANLLIASPFHRSSLEYWQSYVELLKRTQGPGYQQTAQYFNRLAEEYNARLEMEEQKKQARKLAQSGGGTQ